MEELPLLEAGIHDFELGAIGNHFLKDFPSSATRKSLIDGLNAFVAHYSKIIGAPFELWIDGSFTTHKVNPNDIDLVIFLPEDVINELSEEKKMRLKVLMDRATVKSKFGCDVLFCPSGDDELRSYWRGWYGFDRDERAKGIARVMVAS